MEIWVVTKWVETQWNSDSIGYHKNVMAFHSEEAAKLWIKEQPDSYLYDCDPLELQEK